MFAIIDIETTGGNPERDKITEICIVLHDGLSVTDTFTTLINPERSIPSYIERLTGITNDMVQHAPKFFEVARQIVELTEGRVFVAHNVNFDYGFIRAEFKSLGYTYKREKLCTVQLSRKLIPGKPSYSLGRLCESLGISNESRHRAEGDAVATAKLFDMLLQRKNTNAQYRKQSISELNTSRIDKIKLYALKKLPESTGVYYFLNKDDEIIYIGKSKNMRERAIAHFNGKDGKSLRMLNELLSVNFVKTGSELIALIHESNEIKKHKPKYNRLRKGSDFPYCIDYFYDENGVLNFKVVGSEESERALCSFASHLAAKNKLLEWIEDYALCLVFTGITEEKHLCFNYQIRKCFGICQEKESIQDYNSRAEKILEKHLLPIRDFVLLDKGRTANEKSFVISANGHYAGYGYFDESDGIRDVNELRGFLSNSVYYPDADEFLKSWIRNKMPGKLIKTS